MDDRQLRRLAGGLGIALAAFGALPALSPRRFARLFGLEPDPAPAVAAIYRSVAARDVATGIGLWSAATHGGKYAPWLLARTICDGGDAVAALLAIRAGARNPRFLALTALAAGAAAAEGYLFRQARAVAPR